LGCELWYSRDPDAQNHVHRIMENFPY